MVDPNTPDRRSTSEGQVYALFFALAANDQARFDRILAWTRDNLAGGDLRRRLPAWLWGRDASADRWRVLDDNPASDADLWLAYALIEGGRLWGRPGLVDDGLQVLRLVREAELPDLPGLGPMLLPGPYGFVEDGYWRLNPSYLPLPLLRRFATEDRDGPWSRLAGNTLAMVRGASPKGFAPDWTAWNGERFVADPDKGVRGSYDAIRVYLWAGLVDLRDPLRRPLLDALQGPLQMLRSSGVFAEKIDTATGEGEGSAPFGFSAALLPYLQALRQPALAAAERARIPATSRMPELGHPYYAQVLALFGLGAYEGRFRFDRNGRLLPAWRTCRG